MSIAVSATWSGGKPPLQRFQFLKAAGKWADDIGPKLRDAVKDETPVDSGRMKRSERYERITSADTVSMRITAHVPYTPYVVKGARPHIIEPVAARALRWVGPRGPVFAKRVHHPGNKPNDFPSRVRNSMRQEIIDNLRQHIQEALK